MKKIVLFLTACFAFMLVAQAQLSEGQPRATTIKTGNRPQSGDWGLYIGPSFTEVVDLINWAIDVKKDEGIAVVRGLPLVNVKHYFSDNLEFRAGIQFYNVVNKYNGSYVVDDKNQTAKNKYSNALFRLTPGITYHFTTKNIVDVYKYFKRNSKLLYRVSLERYDKYYKSCLREFLNRQSRLQIYRKGH